MKKKGFTLVEMMIVIVIVAILLALSLGISGNRIQTLKNKSVQEQFTYTYNSLFSRNLLTNYYEGQLYDEMVIHLESGKDKFSYSYKNNGEDVFSGHDSIQGGKYTIDNIYFSGDVDHKKPSADIIFQPYVLGCELHESNHTGEILKIKLILNDLENYCIKINSSLCKLEREDCTGY